MKKIVFFSEESIFSGNVKCGIAEVVDSLALALVDEYEVYIVCQEGNNTPSRRIIDFKEIDKNLFYAKAMNINYYIICKDSWDYYSVRIINDIAPDILHIFCDLTLVSKLKKRPAVTIFTFDDLDFLRNNLSFLEDYDYVTTFSCGYRDYILNQNNIVVDKLKSLNFAKVTCGIATEIFNLFLKEPYSIQNLDDKQISCHELKKLIKYQQNGPVFLTMGNISYRKGADHILEAIPLIHNLGGRVVIFGNIDSEYKKRFQELANKNFLSLFPKVEPTHVLPILAGADFYLQPSLMESGGLMPMAASQYGTIPIVTKNGGFSDNFNTDNSIIIEGNITQAINQAFELYNDYLKFVEKQKISMSQNFGWNVRKKEFIKLYESNKEIK